MEREGREGREGEREMDRRERRRKIRISVEDHIISPYQTNLCILKYL